ncbi:MAG: ArsR/SmtB family transcription factor [Gemmatimonadales bacterium]
MDAHRDLDAVASRIAASIGAPARARMLYCLGDGRARTSTDLALVAGVTPSTASVHLRRLQAQRLVRLHVRGKYRYYSLDGAHIAAVLEALSVAAGGSSVAPPPVVPSGLRAARACYDHLAGALGVALYDRLKALRWLTAVSNETDKARDLTPTGTRSLEALGIDVARVRTLRRHFAYACVDWSERRPHLGGALGAAVMDLALKRRWVRASRDSRILSVTALGRREFATRFGVHAV